jgi:hypothetical protein
MKIAFVLLALALVGCGGGKGRTINISFSMTPGKTMAPEASATPLPYAQYADDFVTGIGRYERGDKVLDSEGSLSNADRANYDQAKDWIFNLCFSTAQMPDPKWRAVFENACDELGPATPIDYRPAIYAGAVKILLNALNNGP